MLILRKRITLALCGHVYGIHTLYTAQVSSVDTQLVEMRPIPVHSIDLDVFRCTKSDPMNSICDMLMTHGSGTTSHLINKCPSCAQSCCNV